MSNLVEDRPDDVPLLGVLLDGDGDRVPAGLALVVPHPQLEGVLSRHLHFGRENSNSLHSTRVGSDRRPGRMPDREILVDSKIMVVAIVYNHNFGRTRSNIRPICGQTLS